MLIDEASDLIREAARRAEKPVEWQLTEAARIEILREAESRGHRLAGDIIDGKVRTLFGIPISEEPPATGEPIVLHSTSG